MFIIRQEQILKLLEGKQLSNLQKCVETVTEAFLIFDDAMHLAE
jgi:hypothetical protein